MNVFEKAKSDLSELIKLVRESERYLAGIHANPKLATDETHAKEMAREHRIAELSARYGVTG